MSGRARKPERLWGITYVTGTGVMPDTIRRTRKEAQRAACVGDFPFSAAKWEDEWREWHKCGCRAVRVIVTVEAQP